MSCVGFVQYRTAKNYRNPAWLGPRLGDKVLMSFIIFTLYWKLGECTWALPAAPAIKQYWYPKLCCNLIGVPSGDIAGVVTALARNFSGGSAEFEGPA